MADHHYSEHVEIYVPASELQEKLEIPVIEPRRLRDRELLKRKREEAQEKDTYQRVFRSKRQTKAMGTGRGRRKQVKEPEPEPQPEPKPEPKHEPEHDLEHEPKHELEHEPEHEPQHEAESEQKSELVPDVPQEQDHHEQEHVEHQYAVPTVIEHETADVTILIHEVADGRLPQESTSLLKDKDEVVEVDPEPATEAPEILSFPLNPEQEEHQYYTPLL